MKNTRQGNKRRKKKGPKSKQKTNPKNTKHAMSEHQEKKQSNLGPKPITSSMKQNKQGVCHTGALPFTLKSILRQMEDYGNSNIS
jgi:hypothetical protein